MRFKHGRDIGGNDSHDIATTDRELVFEGISKSYGAAVELGISVATGSVNDGGLLGVDGCRAGKEVDGVEF